MSEKSRLPQKTPHPGRLGEREPWGPWGPEHKLPSRTEPAIHRKAGGTSCGCVQTRVQKGPERDCEGLTHAILEAGKPKTDRADG